jgi:choline transport protein
MITACIVLLYISYAIPISCLLIRGRNNIKHGPFWLGPFGMVANIVLLCWTLFTLIMYSFPYAKPVAASNMNYVSAVYAVVTIIMATDWIFRGRKKFRGLGERQSDVQVVVETVRHGSVTGSVH